MSKQTTLFQTWGGAPSSSQQKPPTNNNKKPSKTSSRKKPPNKTSAAGPSVSNNRFNGARQNPAQNSEFVDLCDDSEDADLLAALEESLKYDNNPPASDGCSAASEDICNKSSAVVSTKLLAPPEPRAGTSGTKPSNCSNSNLFSCRQIGSERKLAIETEQQYLCDDLDPAAAHLNATTIESLPGFDVEAGRIWIYPTNYPIREYQLRIVEKALLRNTMVTLPTGLGKTFVAAVVMFNFYRWYPTSKIIFMAPTKPLVAQQIEACHGVTGIPMEDTAEMTGAMQPVERSKAWRDKRLFFLTPQVIANDLSRGICPAAAIRCLVIDEAHKALGNHAYCQVVRELVKVTTQFRIVALSATPGSDIKAVQQVLNNLLIAHIELRTEDSDDIRPYTHERHVDKIVVPLGDELSSARDDYTQILEDVLQRLRRCGVVYKRDVKSLSKFLILKSREDFRQNPPPNIQVSVGEGNASGLTRQQFGAIEGDFALAMSLFHGYELLQLHGLRSLYNYLESLVSGDKGCGRTRSELTRNANFTTFLDTLRAKYEPVKCANPNLILSTQRGPSQQSSLAIGHPKMAKLEEIVLEHFVRFQEVNAGKPGASTRIIIFSQYRDSVSEITEILNRHRPMVRVMSFIGHSSSGKASKGFSQKDQLKVMRQFREGGYNTLVSTCIGEEGLDIGDVDLIICFDAHKSPIRLVQRMGRTGRKREGRIVMLVTEGKEEQIYNQSEYNKRSIHRAILNGARSLLFYAQSPRMIPRGIVPMLHRMTISVPVYYAQSKSRLVAANVPALSAADGGCGDGGKARGGKAASARRSTTKDGFLTDSELEYWSERFKIDEKEIAVLPPESEFLSLKRRAPLTASTAKSSKRDDARPVLSLTRWLPWQSRLQDVHVVDHSLESRHLVELLEFVDIQGTTDEDAYCLEMQSFLEEDDVLLPGNQEAKSERVKSSSVSPADVPTKMPKPMRQSAEHVNTRSPVLRVIDDRDNYDFADSMAEIPRETDCRNSTGEKLPQANNFSFSGSQRKTEKRQSSVALDWEGNVEVFPAAEKRKSDIWTPPTMEETEKMFSGLEEADHLSPVDVEKLLEEWNLEKMRRRGCHPVVETTADTSGNFDVREITGKFDEPGLLKIDKPKVIRPDNEAVGSKNGITRDTLASFERHLVSEKIVAGTNVVDGGNFIKSSSSAAASEVYTAKASEKFPVSEFPSSPMLLGNRVMHLGKSTTNGDHPDFGQESFKSPFPARHSSSTPREKPSSGKMIPDFSATFDDDIGDDFLAGITTPLSTVKQNQSCLADVSQLTFTQALACVHDSMIAGFSQMKSPKFSVPKIPQRPSIAEKSLSPKIADPVPVDEPKFDLGFDLSGDSESNNEDGDEDDDDEIIPPSPPALTSLKTKASFVNCSGRLHSSGFGTTSADGKLRRSDSFATQDLSDNSSSRRSSSISDLSTAAETGKSSSSVSRSPKLSLRLKGKSPVSNASDLFKNSDCDSEVLTGLPADLATKTENGIRPETLISAGGRAGCSETIAGTLQPTVLSEVTKTTDRSSASDTAGNNNPGGTQPFNVGMFELDDDFDLDELFSPSLVRGARISGAVGPGVNTAATARPSGPIAVVQPHVRPKVVTPTNQTSGNVSGAVLLEGKEELCKASVLAADDNDDSDGAVCARRKNSLRVIASPDSPPTPDKTCSDVSPSVEFKTPLRPPSTMKVSRKRTPANAILSSDDDSPLCVRRKTKRKENLVDGDDDDDFIVAGNRKIQKESKEVQNNVARNEKDKLRRTARRFIDDQADVSMDDSDISGDEEDGSDLDELEGSFINDDTMASQAVNGKEAVDMRAVYMQSVRSPWGGGALLRDIARYRQRHSARRSDIFSQPVPSDDSEDSYEEDSFCVGDNHEETRGEVTVVSSGEDEVLSPRNVTNLSADNGVRRYGLRRQRRLPAATKRRRIRRITESSVDDEAENGVGAVKSRADIRDFHDDGKAAKSSGNLPAVSDRIPVSFGKYPDDRIVPSDILCAPAPAVPVNTTSPLQVSGISAPVFPQVSDVGVFSLGFDDDDNESVTERDANENIISTSQSWTNLRAKDQCSSQEFDVNSAKNSDLTACANNDSYSSQRQCFTVPNNPSKVPTVPCEKSTKIQSEETAMWMLPLAERIAAQQSSLADNTILRCPNENIRQFEDKRKSETVIAKPKFQPEMDARLCKDGPVSYQTSDKAEKTMLKSVFDVQSSSATRLGVKEVGNISRQLAAEGRKSAVENGSRVSEAERLREERLRLSRLKKEEFQKKLSLSQSTAPSPQLNVSTQSAERCAAENSFASPSLCVLVDSQELSGAQEIVSLLRFTHKLNVVVRQLSNCDYIVSNRMAVERKYLSDFINGANKAKIVDRLRLMCAMFERPCLIVEKDPVKNWEKDVAAKPLMRNHYMEHVMACLAQTHIKILYSDSLAETASLLADLCSNESKKGQTITANTRLSSAQEQALKFYASVPFVSCVTALDLLHGFRTVGDFITGSVESIEKLGQVTRSRAEEIHAYLRHRFNPQMIGTAN